MNEQLTALYHAVNVLMARIGEHGHAGSRDPETSAVMDALAAIDQAQGEGDV